MTQQKREGYVIASQNEGDEYGPLYWSNKDGWKHLDDATIFSIEERNDGKPLPLSSGEDAQWMPWLKARALSSPNENVLCGLCCPQCGAYGPFRILATKTGWVYAEDDGTSDLQGDIEWHSESPCECMECRHSDTVAAFEGETTESKMEDFVIRYVVTVPCKDGVGRTLMHPCQGRYTYATQEEAQAWIDGYMANNSQRTLDEFGRDLQARPCRCYPGHFDPQGVWFDMPEGGEILEAPQKQKG